MGRKNKRKANAQQRAVAPLLGWGMSGTDAGDFAASMVDRGASLPRSDYGLAVAFLVSVWAFRCVSVRARMVGSTPWRIIDKDTQKVVCDSKDPNPTPLIGKAIQNVRLKQDAGLFELWEYSLCIWGETYLEKVRTPKPFEFPAGLRWLNPVDVSPIDIGGLLDGLIYRGAGGYTVQLARDEFIISRMFNPIDPTRGTSPMEVALQSITIDANAKAFIRQNYRNFSYIPLIIRPKEGSIDLSQDEVNELARTISTKWMGVQNVGRVQVLGTPLDVTTINPTKLDDQLHTSDSLVRDICSAFGVPRSLAGDTDSAQYKANDDVLEWFYRVTLKPELDIIEDTMNLVVMPFFDETGQYLFEFDHSQYEFITDADQTRQELLAQRLNTTAITLYDYQKQSGVEAPPLEFQNLWKVEGFSGFVPTSELPKLWKYGVLDGVGTVFSSQVAAADTPSSTEPAQLPQKTPIAIPAVDEVETRDGRALCIALDLANHPDLIALQQHVKRLIPDEHVQWNSPDSFHITLVYAPTVSSEQFVAALDAVTAIPVPDLSLHVGSLASFDSVRQYAVHFRIRRSVELLNYQAEIADTLREMGIGLSAYSVPEQYKPHITMCYAPDKVRITYHSQLRVSPAGLVVWDGNEKEVYRTGLNDDAVTNSSGEIAVLPQSDIDNNAQAAADEFDRFVKFTRNRTHIERAFVWQHVDEELYRQIEADIVTDDAVTRHAEVMRWQMTLQARAGILPKRLPDKVDALVKVYRSACMQLLAQSEHRRAHGLPDIDGLLTDAIESAVRSFTLSVLSARALTKERARFETEFYRLVRRAQLGRINENTLSADLFAFITRFCFAVMVDGYSDGGVPDHELTPRDLDWLDAHIEQQRPYVTQFAAEIFAAGEDEALSSKLVNDRAKLWWNKSIMPAYNEGLARAAADMMATFVQGRTQEKCRDCVQLNNRTYRFSEWFAYFGRQLVPCELTECQGWNCQCSIVPTPNKRRTAGRIPRLYGPKRSVLQFENDAVSQFQGYNQVIEKGVGNG
jgi:HK97 family phage portal protein